MAGEYSGSECEPGYHFFAEIVTRQTVERVVNPFRTQFDQSVESIRLLCDNGYGKFRIIFREAKARLEQAQRDFQADEPQPEAGLTNDERNSILPYHHADSPR